MESERTTVIMELATQRDELALALRGLVKLCNDCHLGPVNDGRAMTEEIVGRVEFAREVLARLDAA